MVTCCKSKANYFEKSLFLLNSQVLPSSICNLVYFWLLSNPLGRHGPHQSKGYKFYKVASEDYSSLPPLFCSTPPTWCTHPMHLKSVLLYDSLGSVTIKCHETITSLKLGMRGVLNLCSWAMDIQISLQNKPSLLCLWGSRCFFPWQDGGAKGGHE